MPIQLNIPTQIGLKENVKANLSIVELGDSYMQVTTGDIEYMFEVTSGFLDKPTRNYLDTKLREFNGVHDFYWQPSPDFPIGLYKCSKWSWTQISPHSFILNATFEVSDELDCVSVDAEINISEIDSHVSQAWNFVKAYTRTANLPSIANNEKLPFTNWHIDGKKKEFDTNYGDSLSLFILSHALLNLYELTSNVEILQYVLDMMSSAIAVLYKGMQIPTDVNTYWLPHRLYIAGRSIETELDVVQPNYLQSGRFLTLTSSNGVFTAPNNLSTVFGGNVQPLWKNLNSPPLNSQPLQFGYWIDKYNRKVSMDGTFAINNTPWTPGTIVTSPLEPGTFIFAVTLYSNNYTQANNVIENYPLWRNCFTNEYNFDFATALPLLQTYALLAKITNDPKWQRAYTTTKNSINTIAFPAHRNFIFKADTFLTDVESIPGILLLKINREGTLERDSNGSILVRQNANTSGLAVSHLELCNFVVQSVWTTQTTITTVIECNTWAVFYFSLTTNQQEFFATYYYESGVSNISLKLNSFVKWDSFTWYASIKESFITVNSSADTFYVNSTYQDANFVSARLNLNNNTATGELNLTDVFIKLPAKMFYKSTGDIQIYVTDGADHLHVCFFLPPASDWVEWSLDFSMMSSEYVPDYFNSIKKVVFRTTTSAALDIYFLGNFPSTLPVNSQITAHKLINKKSSASNWKVLNCEVINSLLDISPYTPGILPQSYNKTDYKGFWQGKPLVSNANEALWVALGFPQYAKTALQFKKDSQDSYSASNSTKRDWFFKPAFNTVNWDVAIRPPYNTFSEIGEVSQDLTWHGHTHYAIASTAEYWANNPEDSTAQLVVMRFLTGLFRELNSRRALGQDTSAPNLYPKSNFNQPPQWIKSIPHGDALVLRAAMYANIAGGDRLITMRVLVDMWNSLKSQFVDYYGNSAGSWMNKQAVLLSNYDGQFYREYQTLWHAEIITSLVLLRENKPKLRYPSCNLWVTDV